MGIRWASGPAFMEAGHEARWWVSGFHSDPTGVLVGVEPANTSSFGTISSRDQGSQQPSIGEASNGPDPYARFFLTATAYQNTSFYILGHE
ncbi:hypothetical protein [Aquabacterium humicola]|uniref:hypothetical protein n=1 Tax=Aquabacterium humicola TaxID=3237377 RepID=UPI002543B667|nr:hypothetical protein [Rubrivivax pictus]